MRNGIRSLPRYQQGGPHDYAGRPFQPETNPSSPDLAKEEQYLRRRAQLREEARLRKIRYAAEPGSYGEKLRKQLELEAQGDQRWVNTRRGLGSLPEPPTELSWTRGLGIPERAGGSEMSAKQIARLAPQEQMDRMLLQEFDRLAPVRDIVAGSPTYPLRPGHTPINWSNRRWTPAQLRDEWARRNPSAPGAGLSTREVGSYRGLFPETMSVGEAEDVLLNIMGPDITPKEITYALSDPMFGGISSTNLTNPEINERVYARRYANAQSGSSGSIARGQSARRLISGLGDLPESSLQQEAYQWPPNRPSWMVEHERRVTLEKELMGLPGGSPDVDPPVRQGGPHHRSLRFRAGQALRGAGIASLKAIRNKLLAIVAAGAATAATSNPVSALADVMMSPTQLGSGDLPGEGDYRDRRLYDPASESRFSPEEKMKYYDELTNLGRELGVGRHRPSILQLSREINGPSIRSSYPMGR